MPKGSAPSKVLQARYDRLVRDLDQAWAKKNQTLFKRVRRKMQTLFRGEDYTRDQMEKERGGQRVMTAGDYKKLQWVRKFEKSMLRQGNRK